MQENDVLPSVSTATDATESNIQPMHSNLETQILSPTLFLPSDVSSVSRSTLSNMSISPSSSFPSDSLPRPYARIKRSRSDQNIDRPNSYDPALSDVFERRSNVSFDANNLSEELPASRSSPFSAPRTTIPVSDDAVSSLLFQALPQLGIGHFLQGFTTQISPWRGFSTTRRDSGEDIEDINETGRLLSSQVDTEEEEGGFISSSGRQGTSETPIYSMASSGNFERSEIEPQSVAGDGTELAADVPATGRVDNDLTRGRRDSEESDDQTAMDELQALFRRCHNSLPFVALFLIYFAYQHATGILVFVVGTAAVMGLDQRMRAQVALKDKANTWHLLSIVTMCGIDMVAICSVEGKPNPVYHFSQILQLKTSHGSDNGSELLSTGSIFWQVLWTVLVNDFLIRLWSVVVKALVAGARSDRFQCERKVRDEATTNANASPAVVIADEETDSATMAAPLTQQAVSTVAFYRRKRKLYGIIEMCSIFLRSLLASIPWCSFYQLCASKFMADVFTFAYLFIKGLILANQGRRIFRLVRSFVTLGLEFGVYVLPDELVEAGSPDCSICYESMKQPVKLACSHMFCEECVTEWFDHEGSCPLCRASVESSGPTDAENVKPQYLDGRTSLVPQLL